MGKRSDRERRVNWFRVLTIASLLVAIEFTALKAAGLLNQGSDGMKSFVSAFCRGEAFFKGQSHAFPEKSTRRQPWFSPRWRTDGVYAR